MRNASLRRGLIVVTLCALVPTTIVAVPAYGGSTSITDGDGIDFDAACVGRTTGPVPNSYASPGGTGCPTQALLSLYDGSTEATDLRSTSLGSDAAGNFVATCEVDGAIPAAGSTDFSELDRPSNLFFGAGCKVMFQNPALQMGFPSSVGCHSVVDGRPHYNLHGHWRDGYHFFIGFEVFWENERWTHMVQQGEYDPSPTGGFAYHPLGWNDGSGWQNRQPYALKGTDWDVSLSGNGPTTITVTAPRVLDTEDQTCASGYYSKVFAEDGHGIGNVKGLSTANVQGRDAGAMWFSDVTEGFSGNMGTVGTELRPNIPGIAFSFGTQGAPVGREVAEPRYGGSHLDDSGQMYGGQEVKVWDTAGPGPRCWTPTADLAAPSNPMWVPNQPCHIDDDNVPGPGGNIGPGERGTYFMEFWETSYGFTF